MSNIDVRCPLCGNLNAHHVEDHRWAGQELMMCDDPAHGGCGENFVVQWHLVPTVTTYKLQKYSES